MNVIYPTVQIGIMKLAEYFWDGLGNGNAATANTDGAGSSNPFFPSCAGYASHGPRPFCYIDLGVDLLDSRYLL